MALTICQRKKFFVNFLEVFTYSIVVLQRIITNKLSQLEMLKSDCFSVAKGCSLQRTYILANSRTAKNEKSRLCRNRSRLHWHQTICQREMFSVNLLHAFLYSRHGTSTYHDTKIGSTRDAKIRSLRRCQRWLAPAHIYFS